MLSAFLDTAKAEYATYNEQAAAVEKQADDARSADEELRQMPQANPTDAALKKAIGASSVAALASKSSKALALKLKVAADELEAAQATLLVASALAAPTTHGPAACDIRKTDWQKLKFPASDSFNPFQLKRGSVDVDGGPDPMNNDRVTFFRSSSHPATAAIRPPSTAQGTLRCHAAASARKWSTGKCRTCSTCKGGIVASAKA